MLTHTSRHPHIRRPWLGVSSPSGGGVAGTAGPYFDYSNNPLDSPIQSVAEFTPEAEKLLMELAMFFRSRRVDVGDAFSDFDLPGRFCKRVRRVTRFQFQEVLYFISKGLSGLKEDHVLLLSDIFDDGSGLIRYREFVKAVDVRLEEPGSAGFVPHAASSTPVKNATLATSWTRSSSPRRSPSSPPRSPSRGDFLNSFSASCTSSLENNNVGERYFGGGGGGGGEGRGSPSRNGFFESLSRSSISPAFQPLTEEFATREAKLLGVQPMGPEACQLPKKISVHQRLRVDDILARVRQTLKIYNVVLVDHLRISDKHREGAITATHFRRQMDQLRVFKITEEEYAMLEKHYQIKVNHDWRFHYKKFCLDLQPTGPDIEEHLKKLPRDKVEIPTCQIAHKLSCQITMS